MKPNGVIRALLREAKVLLISSKLSGHSQNYFHSSELSGHSTIFGGVFSPPQATKNWGVFAGN